MIDDQSDTLLGRLTGEHILLVCLIIVSVYMFQESYSFRDPSGLFPRFIAGTTVVAALVLLFRNYLPQSIRVVTEESGDVFSSHEEEVQEVTQKVDADETPPVNEDERSDSIDQSEPAASESDDNFSLESILTNRRFRLTAVTGGYVVLTYLIGFLWATPAFVIAYSLSVGHRWYVTGVLTVTMSMLVYGFMEVLNVQLNSGVLLG